MPFTEKEKTWVVAGRGVKSFALAMLCLRNLVDRNHNESVEFQKLVIANDISLGSLSHTLKF